MQKTNQRTLSLRYKLLIALMALTTVFFVVGYFGARAYLQRAINGIMREELELLMSTYVKCLDGDTLQALQAQPFEFSNPETWTTEMTDPRYWEQQQCLSNEAINNRMEVYTYYDDGFGKLRYGLDQYATFDPESSYIFGSEIEREEGDNYDKLQAGLREFTYYEKLTLLEGNTYYTGASAPLTNSNGEKIGGIVVFLDAGEIISQLNFASNVLGASFLGAYALVALLALAITRNTTSQLAELNNAARRIAGGNYQPIALKPQQFGDEVSELAEAFNHMIEKVQGREEDLKQQVEQLEIIIDMEKKQKDVQEIQSSEYFNDVKARAAEIRRKRAEENQKGEKPA